MRLLDLKTGIIYKRGKKCIPYNYTHFKEMIALNLTGFDTGVNGWWEEDIKENVRLRMQDLKFV